MSTTLSLPAVRPIPIGQLQESPTNPRKTFSEEKLRELAESIRSIGLVQPIIVRPIDQDTYEVVAGARRFRAAKLAGLEDVLAHVKELTDEQVIEVQLIENAQRQDVHPYEEAAAYKALLDLATPQYDVASIAARIGKSISHVHHRLTLCNLIPEAAEMFLEDRFTVGHAILIARLPQEQQPQALSATFRENYATKTKQAVPVRELAQWIREQLTLMLDEVPFDKEDLTLLPEAGSCSACPKRTGFNQALWDDFKEDRCLDAQCYNCKLKAHIAQQIQGDSNLIQISAYYSTTDKNALTRDRYTVIERPKDGTEPTRAAEQPCKHMARAIVVEGGKRGELLDVCADTACAVHNAPTNRTTETERKQQQQQSKQEQELRDKAHRQNRELLDAVVKKAPATLKRADFQMLVLAFVENLSIDDFEALADQYKKVDTEKVRTDQDLAELLRNRVRTMTEQQLVRTLIEVALLPFGHSYKELATDNPLVLAAKRYGAVVPKAKPVIHKKCGLPKVKQTRPTSGQQTKTTNAPKGKVAEKRGAA
ncbi:MAG TPA: ParB/RepB/Spo0J family partition protein [Bryobacteraceae bacterium]|jgi:ParB family chromosome partitioning protein|nr:ParB/RepB/Spo0J family partition protein [Bryobacteraceae bacterium]